MASETASAAAGTASTAAESAAVAANTASTAAESAALLQKLPQQQPHTYPPDATTATFIPGWETKSGVSMAIVQGIHMLCNH